MVLIKDSRKVQIIAAATQLFKSKGFSGTSMRDLAAEVGMVVGSLYSFLSSKDEILQTICFDMAEKFLHHIDVSLATENCSHEERLRHAIQGHVRIITDDINATSVFWNEWKYMQEPWLSDFSRMQVEYEAKFKSLLESGVASGEFSIEDTTFTTMAMLSALNGLQKWRTYSQSPDELGCSFAQLFINGIKK
jgi:TetR/AcrR family transcriptional regulator, cholesterol catabolism regulator